MYESSGIGWEGLPREHRMATFVVKGGCSSNKLPLAGAQSAPASTSNSADMDNGTQSERDIIKLRRKRDQMLAELRELQGRITGLNIAIDLLKLEDT